MGCVPSKKRVASFVQRHRADIVRLNSEKRLTLVRDAYGKLRIIKVTEPMSEALDNETMSDVLNDHFEGGKKDIDYNSAEIDANLERLKRERRGALCRDIYLDVFIIEIPKPSLDKKD